jgi:hypothetical protein
MASRLFQFEKHAGAIHAVISLRFPVAVDNRIAANEIGLAGLPRSSAIVTWRLLGRSGVSRMAYAIGCAGKGGTGFRFSGSSLVCFGYLGA